MKKKAIVFAAIALIVCVSCAIWAHFPPVVSEAKLTSAEKSAVRAVALEYNRKFSFPVRITVHRSLENGAVNLDAHADYAFGRVGFSYSLRDSGKGFVNTGEMEADPCGNPFGW